MQEIVARATEPLKRAVMPVNSYCHQASFIIMITFTFRKYFKAVFEAVPRQ